MFLDSGDWGTLRLICSPRCFSLTFHAVHFVLSLPNSPRFLQAPRCCTRRTTTWTPFPRTTWCPGRLRTSSRDTWIDQRIDCTTRSSTEAGRARGTKLPSLSCLLFTKIWAAPLDAVKGDTVGWDLVGMTDFGCSTTLSSPQLPCQFYMKSRTWCHPVTKYATSSPSSVIGCPPSTRRPPTSRRRAPPPRLGQRAARLPSRTPRAPWSRTSVSLSRPPPTPKWSITSRPFSFPVPIVFARVPVAVMYVLFDVLFCFRVGRLGTELFSVDFVTLLEYVDFR